MPIEIARFARNVYHLNADTLDLTRVRLRARCSFIAARFSVTYEPRVVRKNKRKMESIGVQWVR